MLRPLPLSIVLFLTFSGQAQARLFRQSYGAVVASPDGEGCAWNVNQDYFVPRTCGTGRYDLYSGCKSARGTSPACRRLHPIYEGYCTPYGVCRYAWRDHVYQARCGCGPLRPEYGPWRTARCSRGPLVLRSCGNHGGSPSCGCESGLMGQASDMCGDVDAYAELADCRGDGSLPNVESLQVESLGKLPATMVGGSSGGGGGGGSAAAVSLPVSGGGSGGALFPLGQ